MTTPRAPSASPSARSDAGVLALCVASLLARFALASSGYADALASRVELATPADALARTREGWALATIGVSPYRGSQCHAPPLALLALGAASAADAGALAIAPFVLADGLAALALASIAAAFRRASGAEARHRHVAPAAIAAAYLANPMSVAACVARSSVSAQNALAFGAAAFAVAGDAKLCALAFAALCSLAGHERLVLFAPLALVLRRGADVAPLEVVPESRKGKGGADAAAAAARARAGGSGVSDPGMSAFGRLFRESSPSSPPVALERAHRTYAGAFAAMFIWFGAFGAALFAANRIACRRFLACDDSARDPLDWVRGAFGFRVYATDLRPNLGVRWYFFTEMFDEFNGFFLFAMVLFPYLVAVPALARFGDRRPALALFLALVAADAFGAYPTLGSLAGALGFLPLFSVTPRVSRGSRPPLESSTAAPGFVVAALFAFAIVLAPIFWRLWIETRAANANFFFGACLAYFAARAALAVETARRAIANDRAIKYANGGEGGAGGGGGVGGGGM